MTAPKPKGRLTKCETALCSCSQKRLHTKQILRRHRGRHIPREPRPHVGAGSPGHQDVIHGHPQDGAQCVEIVHTGQAFPPLPLVDRSRRRKRKNSCRSRTVRPRRFRSRSMFRPVALTSITGYGILSFIPRPPHAAPLRFFRSSRLRLVYSTSCSFRS